MKTNYLAVVVAAIAYWLLGAVWFAVIFTKPWMQLEHIPPEQAAAMKGAAAALRQIGWSIDPMSMSAGGRSR